MVGGFLFRHALRNVGVAELLRRSLTTTPRVLVAGLPVLLLLVLPIIIGIGSLLAGALAAGDDGGASPGLSPWGVAALAITLGSVFWGPALANPLLMAAVSRSAIRASFGERVSAGFVLREAVAAIFRSLPVAIAAGVLLAIGHMLCLLPGVILLVFILPIGAVAAIEDRGVVGSFQRAVALTSGHRWVLLGALFVTWTIEGLCANFTLAISPLLFAVSACFFAAWRASLGAIAYNDLRVRLDGLEVDGVVQAIGGRAVVGIERNVEAVSSERLVAMQKGRRVKVILVVCLALLGLGAALGYSPYQEWQQKKKWDAQYEQRRAADEIARQARQAAAPPVTGKLDPVTNRIVEDDASLTGRIRAAQGADKWKVVGSVPPATAARLYGTGAISVLQQLAKNPPEKLELAIVPGLAREIAARKCGSAIEDARARAGDEQAAAFADACPPAGEKRAINGGLQLDGVPLWAAVLAVALELRARDHQTDADELHRAIVDGLLAH